MVEDINFTVVALIILYIAIVWVIGFWVSRQAKNLSDFLIAGKKLGLFVLIFGLMAAFQSGWTWIGLPGALYKTGYPPPYCPGYLWWVLRFCDFLVPCCCSIKALSRYPRGNDPSRRIRCSLWQ